MDLRRASPIAVSIASALAGLLIAVPVAMVTVFIGNRSPVQAAAGTGSVTGQVVWCAPLPFPYGPTGSADGTTGSGTADSTPGTVSPGQVVPPLPASPAMPDAASGAAPGSGIPVPIRPPVQRLIPAGAVLVAVQGTALSARTDENGRFRIDNVPSGQYWTVAAGPVRGTTSASAVQPNVLVQDAGQAVEMGRLLLGATCGGGPLPYGTASADGAPDAGGTP